MATKTPSQVVSENVDRLRRKQGLNQEAIGSALGLSKGSWQRGASRRLNGEVPWTVDQIHPVAELLGVSAGSLLQEQDS